MNNYILSKDLATSMFTETKLIIQMIRFPTNKQVTNNIDKTEGTGGIAWLVECLPRMYEDLGSVLNTT